METNTVRKPVVNIGDAMLQPLMDQCRIMFPGIDFFTPVRMRTDTVRNSQTFGQVEVVVLQLRNKENIELSTLFNIFETIDAEQKGKGFVIASDNFKLIAYTGKIKVKGSKSALMSYGDNFFKKMKDRAKKIYLNKSEQNVPLDVTLNLAFLVDTGSPAYPNYLRTCKEYFADKVGDRTIYEVGDMTPEQLGYTTVSQMRRFYRHVAKALRIDKLMWDITDTYIDGDSIKETLKELYRVEVSYYIGKAARGW